MWCFGSANLSFTQDGLHIAQLSPILPCELIFVIPALHCSPPSTWEFIPYGIPHGDLYLNDSQMCKKEITV